jgi:DUF971 family protein
MARSPDATHIERLTEVGRYALGVLWGDHHDSIMPYRNLRRACPCDACAAAPQDAPPDARPDARPDAPVPGDAERLARVELLGEQSVFLRWADGHETVLLVDELRDLCRCARCIGEPDYPLSGR